MPLPEFIAYLYFQTFGRERLEMNHVDRGAGSRAARKEVGPQGCEASGGGRRSLTGRRP
jgi:hypothetical protein